MVSHKGSVIRMILDFGNTESYLDFYSRIRVKSKSKRKAFSIKASLGKLHLRMCSIKMRD